MMAQHRDTYYCLTEGYYDNTHTHMQCSNTMYLTIMSYLTLCNSQHDNLHNYFTVMEYRTTS